MNNPRFRFSSQSVQWLKFLGDYAIEIVLIATGLWAMVQRFGSAAPQQWISIGLFLATIIFAIYRIRTSVEATDKSSKELAETVRRLDQDIGILLIDHTSQMLHSAFKDIEAMKMPHLHAGHELIKDVYVRARGMVAALKSHKEKQSDIMRIEERFVINDFLNCVLKSLPSHSHWLGITHLTTGWASDADPGFNDLVRTMQKRSDKNELTILRIYCASSVELIKPILPQLNDAARSKIQIRLLIGHNPPPDMSLLWGPLERAQNILGADQPAATLSDVSTAICGMEFDTRRGHSLDRLTLSSPNSGDFRSLRDTFDDCWSRAKPYSPAVAIEAMS